jgi:hypothetical protein
MTNKKRMTKAIIAFLAIFVFSLITGCWSEPSSYSSSSSSYSQPSRPRPEVVRKWANINLSGEEELLLEGTTWQRFVIGNVKGIGEFRSKGLLVEWVINQPEYEGLQAAYTWEREGNKVRIIEGDGSSLSEGTYYPETKKIMFTKLNSYDEKSFETWELIQGSTSVATAPAPQTNIYVQPSAPAQSVAPEQPRQSTPTLQTGLFAANGTNIRMRLNSFLVTAYIENNAIAYGTYRINGNQLVITFDARTSTTGPGANLRNRTFICTITSDASFSDDEYDWARIGY